MQFLNIILISLNGATRMCHADFGSASSPRSSNKKNHQRAICERNLPRPWISDHSEKLGFDVDRRHLQQFLIIVLKRLLLNLDG